MFAFFRIHNGNRLLKILVLNIGIEVSGITNLIVKFLRGSYRYLLIIRSKEKKSIKVHKGGGG